MRHLTVIALLAWSTASQAECLPQICYAVSFEVADCHVVRDKRGEVVSTVLFTHRVTARAASCSLGSAVPKNGEPTLERVQSGKVFGYAARSCASLVGQHMSLFLPEAYFHDSDAAKCPIRDRVLVDLPAWAR